VGGAATASTSGSQQPGATSRLPGRLLFMHHILLIFTDVSLLVKILSTGTCCFVRDVWYCRVCSLVRLEYPTPIPSCLKISFFPFSDPRTTVLRVRIHLLSYSLMSFLPLVLWCGSGSESVETFGWIGSWSDVGIFLFLNIIPITRTVYKICK
jgi:hypothetical protein